MDVDIWSDVACPWCYIGKRRFESALARLEDRTDVRVTFRSFELDPTAAPEDPGDGAERLAEKYGMSLEEAWARQAQLVEVAAAEGLDFRLDLTRSANTFDAHRVVHLAREHGAGGRGRGGLAGPGGELGGAMKERLMRAHFTEGRLVSDPETLVALAAEVGVPDADTRKVLGGNRYADAVREEESLAGRLGITAVPTFVVDRAIAVSGAQPPDVLLSLLQEGRARAAGGATAASRP